MEPAFASSAASGQFSVQLLIEHPGGDLADAVLQAQQIVEHERCVIVPEIMLSSEARLTASHSLREIEVQLEEPIDADPMSPLAAHKRRTGFYHPPGPFGRRWEMAGKGQ
jgi:hypothetical protein